MVKFAIGDKVYLEDTCLYIVDINNNIYLLSNGEEHCYEDILSEEEYASFYMEYQC